MRRPLFVVALAAVAFTAACSNSPTAPTASAKLSPKSATHDDAETPPPADTTNRSGYTVGH